MPGRVIEVASDGRHLALSRGFMTIESGGDEIGRVPLDDIAVLLCNAHGLTYSNNLLVKLRSVDALTEEEYQAARAETLAFRGAPPIAELEPDKVGDQ